jgi:hypothetical protein
MVLVRDRCAPPVPSPRYAGEKVRMRGFWSPSTDLSPGTPGRGGKEARDPF